MNFEELQALFFEENEEALAQVESILLEMEDTQGQGEAVNACFRIFHTIKGSAAMAGLASIGAFTHHVETVLDDVRGGRLAVSPEMVSVILASKDHLLQLFDAVRGGDKPAPGVEEGLLARLQALAPPGGAAKHALPAKKRAAPKLHTWTIRFSVRRGATLETSALLALVGDLRAVGGELVLDAADVALPATLDPAVSSLRWSVTLVTDKTENELRDMFIFVDGQLDLDLRDEGEVAGEVAEAPPFELFGPPVVPAPPRARAPEPPPPREAGPSEAKSAKANDAMVRVSSAKLDLLVNLVSELVITQSRLVAVASRIPDAELATPVEEIERLVGELREGVLGIRMMPIGSAFGRFKRLVHDLSAQLGKDVTLVTEGAETELDKSVLDQLVDPLLHLIRNSLDHGIEPAEVRRAAGKPERGTVRLVAKHAGQNVVVTIQDDGKGLDAEAIRAKAIQKNLLSADAVLPPSELFKLIFVPGFSTAQALTSVSGRGVGMDVVKRQIESLRGTVKIASERGAGTTISLELPLTLAIIDGLLVEVAGDRYIMPLAAVTETVELPPGDRQRRNGNRVVVVRDEWVPYVSLRGLFGAREDECENEKVVILETGEDRVGMVVDRVLGGHQTVIQPLGRFYRGNEAISGATIMGDGGVALILDVPGVVRLGTSAGVGPSLRPADAA